MGSATPKQFLDLNGMPVLARTVKAFYDYDPNIKLIAVLPADQIDEWQGMAAEHIPEIKHETCAGGSERFHSVKAGLELVTEDGIVAVHDGVRPLVSKECIHQCFEIAASEGSAIPVVPVNESMRKVEGDSNRAEDRSQFRLVQTPQCFKTEIIKEAYNCEFSSDFTDDASVVSKAGHTIQLVDGHRENIKITNPLDLDIAKATLNQ